MQMEMFASINWAELDGSKTQPSFARWTDVLRTPAPDDQLCNTVHGALRVYDLPHLIDSLGPDKVTVEEPVDARGKILASQ